METRNKQCNNSPICANNNSNNILSTKTHEKILLNLNMTENHLFSSNQTPTPTSLIKNCEEVGLFDDLQHVNPFEETFRRAIEQKVGQTSTVSHHIEVDAIEDSLHTPQVFPQLDPISNNCDLLSGSSALDVTAVDDELLGVDNTFRLSATRYSGGYMNNDNNKTCNLTEASQELTAVLNSNDNNDKQLNSNNINNNNNVQYLQLPSTIQLLQPPPVITLNLTANNLPTVAIKPTIINNSINNNSNNTASIPVQTVKPFIYPKSSSSIKDVQNSCTTTAITTSTLSSTTINTTTATNSSPEPSSASLTPTSQLPIKERLKAILNTSSKCLTSSTGNSTSNSSNEPPQTGLCSVKKTSSSSTKSLKTTIKNFNDGIERKRAAATRYRHKIRNEHQQLQKQNAELLAENQELRTRLRHLEEQLTIKQTQKLNNATAGIITVPAQIQIPSSSIQFVMNLPKLTVPLTGQAQILNAINYDFNRK